MLITPAKHTWLAGAVMSPVGAALQGWKNIAHKLGMSAADIAVYATAIEGD